MATDDADVPDSGAVFTFGKSKFADNLPDKFWIRNDKVLQVSCGDEHTALVAESGRVFTFGTNDWGQLGLGHTRTVTKPSCIKSLKKEKVKLVGCGRSTTLLATESGVVYSFGANGEGQLGVEGIGDKSAVPVKIKDLPETAYKMLSCGVDHSMALTQDGDIYTWGGGSEGQLGLGPDMMDTETPIKLPVNEPVSCISCGYYHSAFITESGKLFTFGETEGGKLGHGDNTEDSSIPREVTGVKGKAVWVACGGNFTVVVTDSGKVYTCGDGSSGQLGLGTLNLQVSRLVQLATLAGHKIRFASCGDNHTALVSDKGILLTFGDGRHGKLGLGVENFANQFIPSQVSRFGNFYVEKVSCGGCHTLVLARPKQSEDEVDSGHEDEAEESEDEEVGDGDKTTATGNHLNILRYSQDLDLTGSFAARDRRRGKQDLGTLSSRTLPPLNSTFSSGRGLPPLNSLSVSREDPFGRSMLPSVTKEVSEDLESSRPTPRSGGYADLSKLKNGVKKKGAEEDSDESEEESESEEEAKPALKARPVPALRFKVGAHKSMPKKKPESDSEEESEDSEEETKNSVKDHKKVNGLQDVSSKKGKKKPMKKNQKSDSESEESEEESHEEELKKANKKRIGFFGKRRDSEEEDEEAGYGEANAKSKNKGKGGKKGKQTKMQKGKGKDAEKSSDSEKDKNGDQEEVDSKEKEQKNKDDKKDDKGDVKPEEKKKSKLCTIL